MIKNALDLAIGEPMCQGGTKSRGPFVGCEVQGQTAWLPSKRKSGLAIEVVGRHKFGVQEQRGLQAGRAANGSHPNLLSPAHRGMSCSISYVRWM
jgi:hypothetical protein